MAVDADSVARFAADLRELRHAGGDPILEALSRECGVGRTALSNAFRGEALPTKKTVSAVVGALGGDQDAWVQRWALLRAASVAAPVSGDATDATGGGAARGGPARVAGRGKRWWLVAAVGVACLAVGFGCGLGVGAAGHRASSPGAISTAVAVATGDDPWAEPACQSDAVREAFGTRADHYLVEVFWSKACQAVWGQVTRFDGERVGNALTATVFGEYDPSSSQTATGSDVQMVHTPLLVQPDRMQSLCVTGVAQVGAEKIDLAPGVCIDSR